MKIKFTFFVLLALISATTFSQRLSLEVYSNVTEENKFLSSMDYNKNFNSIEELTKEVEKIVENLQKIGFIKARIESIKEIEKNASGQYADSPTWNYKHGDLHLGNHLLLNIFSSRMSKMELKTMVTNGLFHIEN